MSNLTYHTARRRHLRPCDFSGLPIEPGDRYMKWAGHCYESGEWMFAKGLKICQEVCTDDEGTFWLDTYDDFLEEWLKRKLWELREDTEELHQLVRECMRASRDYRRSLQ